MTNGVEQCLNIDSYYPTFCAHTQQESTDSLQRSWSTTNNWDIGFGYIWLVLEDGKKKKHGYICFNVCQHSELAGWDWSCKNSKVRCHNMTWTGFLYWSQWGDWGEQKGEKKEQRSVLKLNMCCCIDAEFTVGRVVYWVSLWKAFISPCLVQTCRDMSEFPPTKKPIHTNIFTNTH